MATYSVLPLVSWSATMKYCVPEGLGNSAPKPVATAIVVETPVIVPARTALASLVYCRLPIIYSLREHVLDHEVDREDFFERYALDVGRCGELHRVFDAILT